MGNSRTIALILAVVGTLAAKDARWARRYAELEARAAMLRYRAIKHLPPARTQ